MPLPARAGTASPRRQSPHSATSGGTPTPRKDSAASATIDDADVGDGVHEHGRDRVGQDVAEHDPAVDAPIDRAASTYSASRSASTWPRASRAMVIQPSATSARTTRRGRRPAAAHDSDGADEQREGQEDVDRRGMTSGRSHPPRNPASAPSATPMSSGEEHRGQADDHGQPGAVDDPRVQVAAERVGAEPVLRARRRQGVGRFCSRGSYGVIQGSSTATTARPMTTTRPSIASVLCR